MLQPGGSTRGVSPLAHNLPAHFQATGRLTSPSVTATSSMKHHVLLFCQLFEFNLFVLTSVPDPIVNMCWIKDAEISSLITRGPAAVRGVRCRARRAAATRRGWPRRDIAANQLGCGAAAAVRSVPLLPWGEAYHP